MDVWNKKKPNVVRIWMSELVCVCECVIRLIHLFCEYNENDLYCGWSEYWSIFAYNLCMFTNR